MNTTVADGAFARADWDWVVRTHAARVHRIAYRLTGNQHDANDLTQDVFVRVFRSLSTFDTGVFEAWLYRITMNSFLDELRRRRRLEFDDRAAEAVAQLPARDPTPAQLVDDYTFSSHVQTALDSLPVHFRAAIILRDIHGLTYAQIGVRLGVKDGTIRSRIHRGRAQLRAALHERSPRARQALCGNT